MSNWRDLILKDFIQEVSRITLVIDPDGLLTEGAISFELRNRGFEIIEFYDVVEFRYIFESKYRRTWDLGKHFDLVIVIHAQDGEYEDLPYDIIGTGRKLSYCLKDLFPRLSYPVVNKLDRSLFDAIFEVQNKHETNPMGDEATKDFILSQVFKIEANSIDSDVELLRTLLRVHHGELAIPDILFERLVNVLRKKNEFQSWPLEEIIPHREKFFAFLQERWPIFLNKFTSVGITTDNDSINFKYCGPKVLPFDHNDIYIYIDKLFVEGRLSPVNKSGINVDRYSWIKSGIIVEGESNKGIRIARLLELVREHMPGDGAKYSDWLIFATEWAELGALIHTGCKRSEMDEFQKMGFNLNNVFARWLAGHYADLISISPTDPVMLHHVARHLARQREKNLDVKVALIVVDGLSYEQWITMRHILEEQDQDLGIIDTAIFAWIPTLTSVSRQSIFAGKYPRSYPSSIHTTEKEEKYWHQFWEETGLSRLDIEYQRCLRDGEGTTVLEAVENPGKTKVVGLVVDMVDRIMHGNQLGMDGMHDAIRLWCKKGFLVSLIGYLLDSDYQVWLTSDHGNIECQGKGCPSEGVIPEIRGERVRVYPTQELCHSTAQKFPFAREWDPIGLPEGYYPLVTIGNDAFIRECESNVGHGGISIEEVVVPFVRFRRRERQ